MSRMAAPVSLDVHGRQVIVTHPGRVVFPAHNDRKGYTKFDLVRYYLAVAEGAMRGVAGRPMILKRFVKGISAEAVFRSAHRQTGQTGWTWPSCTMRRAAPPRRRSFTTPPGWRG